MKLIYVIIIFLVFFNIFHFMFAWTEMFNYMYEPSTSEYDINVNESEITPAEQVFENITGGANYDNVFSIFFGNFDGLEDLLVIVGLIGAAAVLAWATKSLAPFVIVFLGNIIKNTYENSLGVFQQFPVNDYIWLIFGIGMILLLIITSAEYMTHGDV